MKLSNTMIMNCELMPTKKAFTLAEVLITLSILGVVAALTIPSLVNRQSEMAAIVKLKKAISQYEQVTEVYMAENEAQNFSGASSTCATLKNYFKMVTDNNNTTAGSGCVFTTADGVVWSINGNGYAVAYDSKSPKYAVAMWAEGGAANTDSDNSYKPTADLTPAPSSGNNKVVDLTTTGFKYYKAANFLKINKAADASSAGGNATLSSVYSKKST